MRPLMWLRADLRTADNRALHAATHAATRGVVAVFLLAPRQWRAHDWGAIRVNFLLRNLAALRDDLERYRVPLLVRSAPTFDDAAPTLLAVAREHGCDALYFNREYELNERRRDDAVCEAFRSDDRKVHAFDDQLILAPGSVRTNEDGCYTVFTPFSRRWHDTLTPDDREPVPPPRKQSEAAAHSDSAPASVDGFDDFDRADLWPAGESSAQGRLGAFIGQRLEDYHQRRDRPDVNGTSTLSPYLTAGVISARQCLAAAREANRGRLRGGRRGIDTWISELVWREFYKHILVGFPGVCRHRAFRPETEQLEWSGDQDRFAAWCEGRTGYPIVDAGMRQLRQTGWMHNRLRMIVAMFLSKDLWLDWRWGERYFMERLVDGDLAANNGGWQWSASTGTDAAPYFRIFNPASQSEKADPEGTFIREFVPELADLPARAIHDPAGRNARPAEYPEPIVDHKAARERAIAAFRALKD